MSGKSNGKRSPKKILRCYDVDATKPDCDKKSYRLVLLPNGIRALLVHDPESSDHDDTMDGSDGGSSEGEGSDESGSEDGSEDGEEGSDAGGGGRDGLKKAACALAVGVGSFSDPPQCQGLAHYLEHMLFMGSKKYPGENEYDAFISKHGGSANAYTECEYTLYHFDIMPEHLEGALDIFAQFFTAPLMTAASSDRELNAIESEFCLSKNNDMMQELRCAAAPPRHPYRTFTWGNLASLRDAPAAAGVDVRGALLRFHAEHYCAPAMQLVVLGHAPLDELEALVERCFSKVRAAPAAPPADAAAASSSAAAPPPFQPQVLTATVDGRPCRSLSFEGAGPPLGGQGEGEGKGGVLLHRLRPVRDSHRLTLAWALPPQARLYRSKPGHYVGHMIGHEGEGSLLSLLRDRQWATGLSAGIGGGGHSSGTYGALFEVSVTLTAAGVAAWHKVVEDLFVFLGMVRGHGVLEWVHKELQAVSEAQFRFQEEEEPAEAVAHLASMMVPSNGLREEHLLSGPYLMDEWRPDAVRNALARLTPAAARIDLFSSAFGCAAEEDPPAPLSGAPDRAPLVEPHFGLEYWVDELPAGVVAAWEAALARWEGATPLPEEGVLVDPKSDKRLRLAPKNAFIATDFSLRPLPESTEEAPGAQLLEGGALAGLQVPSAPPPAPTVVWEEGAIKVWHLQDAKFRQPRGEVYAKIVCNDAAGAWPAARQQGLVDLAARLINEHLTEFAYMATVAELHYSLKATVYGFQVHVHGFSHRLPVLLEAVLTAVLGVGRSTDYPAQNAFDTQKEALMRAYANAGLKPDKEASCNITTQMEWWPLKRAHTGAGVGCDKETGAMFNRSLHVTTILCTLRKSSATASRLALLFDKHYFDREKAAAIADATLEDLRQFLREHLFVGGVSIEAAAHGNITQEEAVQLGRSVAAVAAAQAAGLDAQQQHVDRRARRLPRAAHLLHCAAARDPTQDNSALESYWQAGEDALPLRAALDALEALLEEPLYDTLRTQQQLGYSVACGVRATGGVLGFCVRVVSAAYPPSELLARVDAFLAGFADQLEAMTPEAFRPSAAPACADALAGFADRLEAMAPEAFRQHLVSLAQNKLQPDNALCEVAERHWSEISTRRRHFSAARDEVLELQSVDQAALVALCREWFRSGGGGGSALPRLTVMIAGGAADAAAEAAAAAAAAGGGVTAIDDIAAARASGEWYPVLIGDS
ncbi:Metalloenzyme, LuxS/M16 peptidase-like protein [Tribonema minus]|uniref:Metalloenzyme, LuxS/M16 peptidase-like protein n=1 Tax=Tribonema minus TaxID=303371 RepID=A0A835YU08_9STRA|nr:Metalloenzyme, LuxS/M16 peptidase-like protein [Tribonema minus]